MTPYSNSRIMRRCGQLGIPYPEAIGSRYFSHQGLISPELFIQYREGVEGYTGPPDRRRRLDSTKTLPHDLQAIRSLLSSIPGQSLTQASKGLDVQINNTEPLDQQHISASSEPISSPSDPMSTTDFRVSSLSGAQDVDLTDIITNEDDASLFIAELPHDGRVERSYIPPALPREQWVLNTKNGNVNLAEWSSWDADVVIAGNDPLSINPREDSRKNKGYIERGKKGRRSKRRARSISGTWVHLDAVACQAWCDAVVEKNCLTERDIDELIAECTGDVSVEDLRTAIVRALEGFGFEVSDQPSAPTALWDYPTDLASDELYIAIDATLNASVKLPGTERLAMEKLGDEAELQTLLAARQELAQANLAHEAALQAAINLCRNWNRDSSQELQTLAAWTCSGRPSHGKIWRAAVNAIQMLWLSDADYHHIVHEGVAKAPHEENTQNLSRSLDNYTILLKNTQTRYLPYVRRLVSRSLDRHEEMEDAFQAATFGLFRALDLLNGKSAGAFRYYASQWINQKFLEWRAYQAGLIRIPLNRLKEVREFNRTLMTLKPSLLRLPKQHLLAEQLGWKLEKVAEFEYFLRTSVSLSSVATGDGWGTDPLSDYLKKELREVIDATLDKYDERDAKVIRLYYGLDYADEHTLEEIGSILGVTRERIRQLRDRMLDRLKSSSNKTELHYFALHED
jgi:RNA polymerase primary sigma factor